MSELLLFTVSWTKSGDFKVLLPASQNLEDCVVELEWIESSATGPDSGILAVFSKKREKSLLQVSLAEIICIMNCSESGQYCFSVHTVKSVESEKSPLMLFLSSENDFHDWFHCISAVSCVINGMSGNPSNHCIWCTTELGDIYMTDIQSLRNNQITENSKYFKEFNVREHNVPFKCQLLNGFPVNSEITILGRTPKDAERFFVNLECSATGDVAFHFNPRFHDHVIVRNSHIDGKWGTEEKEGELFLQTNSDFTLTILCLEQKFKIFLNGLAYTYYEHRLPPENITDVHFGDQVKIFNILYETTEVILHLPELFWRKIEGYLHTVETCISGVTWGLGCNSVPWVYVGKLNSAGVLKTEEDETSVASFEYSAMMDTKDMFVYENQRWNPLTGFTTRGLPTDRSMWSDETGRIKLTKDNVMLPNTRWQWITSWQIDYKTPGGVDRDGWQYAVDFPASYHPFNNITDTVRRRRWVRTCRIIVTKSPWQEVGNTKLKDLSLSTLNASANSATISVWAVTNNGEVLFRHGVSTIRPAGKEWQHVPTDLTIHCVSTSDSLQVWCCAENGISLWRFGITTDNPIGDAWHYVEPAKGCIFQKISVGKWTVWALDKLGDLYVRKEISPLFPEGTHWRRILCDNIKFKHIYASQDHIWAITIEGIVCRRIGVSKDYPEGASWIFGLKGNWLHLSE